MAIANPTSLEALSPEPEYDLAPDNSRHLGAALPIGSLTLAATAVVEAPPEVRLPYYIYNASGKPLLAGLTAEQRYMLESTSPRVAVIDPRRPLPAPGEDVTLRTSIVDRLGRVRVLPRIMQPIAPATDEVEPRVATAEDGREAFNMLIRPQIEHELRILGADHGIDHLKISAGPLITSDEPFWKAVEHIGPYSVKEYIPSIHSVLAPHHAHHDTEGPLVGFHAAGFDSTKGYPPLPVDITRRLTTSLQQLRSVIGEHYPEHAAAVFGIVRVYNPRNVTETMRYGARSHPSDATPDRLLGVFVTPYAFPG